MAKYRINFDGFSYVVELLGNVNYDGIIVKEWHEVKSFNTKEEDENYINY
jgi:hypothetical protein